MINCKVVLMTFDTLICYGVIIPQHWYLLQVRYIFLGKTIKTISRHFARPAAADRSESLANTGPNANADQSHDRLSRQFR